LRFRLEVGRRAERQIREASDWWLENRRAAPELFKAELQRGFELITAQPHLGSPSLSKRTQEVRRVHLGRIHYHLYYRVKNEQQVVEVLAFWHASRGTGPPI
jgi:plasmid stabilization system protein ParE